MCDTFVNLSGNLSGSVFFGKNSDREPHEAQQIVRYPAGARPDRKVRATYIEVDCPATTLEVILSKPFQMWGAEMGCNEKGVVIGNEAVFTKMPFEKKNKGLTGMDLLRLSLEISENAQAALQHIIQYLEKYGQDACGGYTDRNFYYHNSFLIADKKEAYVLETAGKYWAYEKVKGYRAISNGLSIGEDYDGLHPEAADFARKKGWLKKGQQLHFRNTFSAWLMPRLAACDYRRDASETKGTSRALFSVKDAFSILRTHEKEDFHPANGSTRSLCMHASGLFTPHQSVGSMVVELRKDKPATVWLTGTSAPCLSLFKPFYFGNDVLEETNFISPTTTHDDSYWWQWEQLHRNMLSHYSEGIADIRRAQDRLENSWISQDHTLIYDNWNLVNAQLVSRKALKESIIFRNEMMEKCDKIPVDKTGFLYRNFWKRIHQKATLKL